VVFYAATTIVAAPSVINPPTERMSKASYIIVLIVVLLVHPEAVRAQTDSLDRVPSWYHGDKPWTSIGKEGRLKMLPFRRAYESQEKNAREKSPGPSASNAAAGRTLLNRIVTKYRLDDFYRTPDTFGGRMVIWIPEGEWAQLSGSQKNALEAFLSSSYKNYGIGTGRVKGREVLSDRLVIER
jgi:hypothetical protein